MAGESIHALRVGGQCRVRPFSVLFAPGEEVIDLVKNNLRYGIQICPSGVLLPKELLGKHTNSIWQHLDFMVILNSP